MELVWCVWLEVWLCGSPVEVELVWVTERGWGGRRLAGREVESWERVEEGERARTQGEVERDAVRFTFDPVWEGRLSVAEERTTVCLGGRRRFGDMEPRVLRS